MKKIVFLLCFLFFILGSVDLSGQSLRLPNEGYKQCFGIAFSTGVFIDKPAWFVGISFDYAYIIGERWILLGGIAFDQEHKTHVSEGERKTVQTLTPNIAVGYAFSRRLAIGAGVGKGLWDTDNSEEKMKFTSKGNLTVGILCSYTILLKGPHGIDITGGLERGLITPETNITLEMGYALSF